MSVEIGSLVVRGTFGSGGGGDARSGGASAAEVAKELSRMRRQILEEVEEMLAEADRRRKER